MSMVTKQKVVSSSIWKMLDSLVTKGASTVISIILARLLIPDDYGIITLTAVFINFTAILVQGGINTALVRKEKVDELDYSTALFFSLFVAGVCYLGFFFSAPIIAEFYGNDIICPVLRVQMLTLFIGAFGNVRNAIITREFRFKELCVISVISTLSGGILGIYLAYSGFGVWALVFYTLARDALSVVLLFLWVRWKPNFRISSDRLKELFSFSIWVLLSSILDFWGNNLSSVILGKKYSMGDLGIYSKGGQFPELFCLHTFGALSSVLLPTMASAQNENERLKGICRKMVSVSAYIIFPMMIGLAVVARRLIPVLYTEKWNNCIPILYMACFYYGVNPFRAINMQLLYAKGKSKLAMMIEIIRFVLLNGGILLVIFVFHKSIYWVSRVSALVALCTAINMQLCAKKLIGYGIGEWFIDIFPNMLISIIMGIGVFFVGKIGINDVVIIFLQIMLGVLIYIGLSLVTRNKTYYELKGLIFEMLRKKRNLKNG